MILIFCGDVPYKGLAEIGHELLQIIHDEENQHLTDEVYMLMCKHITKNPSWLSTYRAYKLLILLLRTIPPSQYLYVMLSSRRVFLAVADLLIVPRRKPYLKNFLTVGIRDDTMGLSGIIGDALELMEAATRLNIKATSVASVEEIENDVLRDSDLLRRVRRGEFEHHKQLIHEAYKKMAELEEILHCHVIPKAVMTAASFSARNPNNVEAAEDAWEKLRFYGAAQNLKTDFLRNLELCQISVKIKEGCQLHYILDLKVNVSNAEHTPYEVISDAQLQTAKELVHVMEIQQDIALELRAAMDSKSVESLKASLARADSHDCDHLELYSAAKNMVEDLEPNLFSKVRSILGRLVLPPHCDLTNDLLHSSETGSEVRRKKKRKNGLQSNGSVRIGASTSGPSSSLRVHMCTWAFFSPLAA